MPKTEWAAEVMVRLTADDFGALRVVQGQFPGCGRAETFRLVLRAAVLPSDTLVRYRLPPSHKTHHLMPEWRSWGPFSPVEALWRCQELDRKGFEVETVQIAAAKPRPAWPEPEECEASGALHADDEAAAGRMAWD